MSYVSLYRKWRPATFTDVLGQAHVTETLTGALTDDRVSHAYLFSGPRGTGKTSTARILAKALNCETGPTPEPCGKCRPCTEIAEGSSLDVFEMDAASHTSVDDVREIRERIPFASAGGGHKVYIIDEAHQLSNPAFNALLKMLEEPPSHVVFVLCTTEAHRLPATVVSRCQRFEFRRIPADAVAAHLAKIAAEEGIEAAEDALSLIARHAKGSVRDALSLLDQAAGTTEGGIGREAIHGILGDAPEDVLGDLASSVADADLPAVFRRIEELSEQGWDPRQLLRQLLEEFRAVFLVARGAPDLADVADDHVATLQDLAGRFGEGHLEWVLRVLGDAQADMRLTTHPRLTLEVALARAAAMEAGGTETLLARIERLERALVDGEGVPAAAPVREADRAPQRRAEAPPPAPLPQDERGPQRAPEPDAAEPTEAPAPPAAEQTAPEEPSRPAPAGDLSGRWDEVLEVVRPLSRVAHTHLQKAWPLALEDDELVVAFDRRIHMDGVLQRPDKLKHVVQAVKQVFGRTLTIRGELREDERPEGAGGSEDGEATGGGGSDPVELVVRGLGAEVVEEVEDA